MPLRPPAFEVHPENPYERDTLGRQRRVEALCNLIKAEDEAAVVSVDGAFGTGKSVFLKMCAARLRNEGVDVAEFNAWQQGHTHDPLVDLVCALAQDGSSGTERLKEIALKLAWRFATNTVGQLASAATAGIVDLAAMENLGKDRPEGRFAAWGEAEDQIAAFKDALAELVNSGCGHLVVLIDELDRCLPEYAMELLNTARHLFDVPGVVIVLGINRTELGHRVRTVYGQGCCAEAYLRRFVDLSISLGDPPAASVPRYVAGVCEAAHIDDDLTGGEFSPALALIAEQPGISLRDIEQTAHHAAQIFSPARESPGWAWNRATTAMLLLRQIDRSLYKQFAAGRISAFEAVKALREGFPLTASTQGPQQSTLPHLEVMLLWLGDAHDFGSDEPDDFNSRYTEAKLGDHAEALECLEALTRFDQRASGFRCSLQGVAARIELVT